MSDKTTTLPSGSGNGQTSSTVFKKQIPHEKTLAPELRESKPLENVVSQHEKLAPTTNIPLSEYREQNEQPYANKFFNLSSDFNYLPHEEQAKLQDIDKFIELEIQERGWKPNVASYERIMQNIAQELDMDEINTMDQIERLSGFARNMIKLNGVDDIRKELRGKLRKLTTTKQMNDEVLRLIGKKIL